MNVLLKFAMEHFVLVIFLVMFAVMSALTIIEFIRAPILTKEEEEELLKKTQKNGID